jgi:NADPH-dependent 2,4-dienoyl-CoA reductase/sulfur reductase-like enzyme
LTLQSGKVVDADAVVAGIGIKPNTELAESAGIKIDNGIVVDEFLRTNIPYIYAAGDAANFYNPALEERIRVEHEDNANRMGRHAGEVMAGDEKPYHHLPFFYSDMFELGYEAVGELDPALETTADWREPYKEGVVYYLKNGRVKGILLWGIFGKVNAARELIGRKEEDLRSKI